MLHWLIGRVNTLAWLRLLELEAEFKEGKLTEKSFWKNKRTLLTDVVTVDVGKQLCAVDEDFADSRITEREYFDLMDGLLRSFSAQSGGCKENKIHVLSSSDSTRRPDGVGSPNKKFSGLMPKDNKQLMECIVTSDVDGPAAPPLRESRARACKAAAAAEGEKHVLPSPGPATGFTRKRAAKESKSPLPCKAAKLDAGAVERITLPAQDEAIQSAQPNKCCECEQYLEGPELRIYSGDPSNALDEFVALVDERLQLETENRNPIEDEDYRPQHKITHFSVYDELGHLCPFGSGLVEKNKLIYFSGYVKPIYDENPSIEGGVPVRRMGPISEWFTAGFDGGNPLIAFTTEYADYFLMSPSDEYEPYMPEVKEKVFVSSLVISFLSANPDASCDDLLNKIQTAVLPNGVRLTEDSLFRHAPFVLEQVQNYDLGADPDEPALQAIPGFRAVINLAGSSKRGGKKERGVMRRRVQQQNVLPKKERLKDSLATTTRLVRQIFDSMFQGQIDDKVGGPCKKPCGKCQGCTRPDCGKCTVCKGTAKSGGVGKSKHSCIQRRCLRMEMAEADEDEPDEEEAEDAMDKKVKETAANTSRRKSLRSRMVEVRWLDEPLATENGKTYYSHVRVNGDDVRVGDCVQVSSDDDLIGLVRSMWESDSEKKKSFHAQWFYRGSETILGDTADPRELFLVDECDTCLLDTIARKVKVVFKEVSVDWSMLGGLDDGMVLSGADGAYFYQKHYTPDHARFEDVPLSEKQALNPVFCPSCHCKEQLHMRQVPVLTGKEAKLDEQGSTCYSEMTYKDTVYEVGSCCYVDPAGFTFNLQQPQVSKKQKLTSDQLDDKLYPEAYRKTEYVKGSNEACPEPYRIVRILSISCKMPKSGLIDPSTVKLRVAKFYRPENTHLGLQGTHQADLNLLYWSSEETYVDLESLAGACAVRYWDKPTPEETMEYFLGGNDLFYFTEAYNANLKAFEEVPTCSRSCGNSKVRRKGQDRGTKIKSTESIKNHQVKNATHRLRMLDVFAGCGGLSQGIHQSGAAVTKWAIEKDELAAQAYKLNNPLATVFTDDCNTLLRLVMEGTSENTAHQKLPQKGEVEFLCGGPPCQGFSGLNRFKFTDYSRFKNSLIASYLSYCDYYRPRFFLLENVRNFVSFKNSMVLKLTLRCLIRMGYQCTFGILQAGCYGVPQTRRRAIILAAAPGEKLPAFPEPLHVFSPKAMQLSVVVDDKKYVSNITRMRSAPYRTITVRDAMSDLPEVRNGAKKDEISYSMEPETQFQRMMRGKMCQPVLRDHICKDMNPLVLARMQHIPTAPGSDWRDLPNVKVKLSDGTTSKLLEYSFNDKKNGKGPTGRLRGVCACAEGKPCEQADRQYDTLIPWCLPHTANRHNHWSGLYGRLEWDGFFSTTVTNPEPMGKQGRVLHPEQHRVVSVRECARSQGFPDCYLYSGNTLDRHRQVGNAVPPPLAKEIGFEIKKCLEWKK